MNLNKLIFTENACYKAGRKIKVKGIMVHSTGANNPWLKRYVGPDDGKLGKNQYNNHWNTYHPGGREVCVHGFIGKLADGSIATYQTLPWDHRGWHAGGSANDTHIGFEICEDGLTDYTYFQKVYREAVELCAFLCKEYGLTEQNIICHSEGYKQGVASNHGDVMHWFPKHGKSMDTFRAEVKALLATDTNEDAEDTSEPVVTYPEKLTSAITVCVKPGRTASPRWVLTASLPMQRRLRTRTLAPMCSPIMVWPSILWRVHPNPALTTTASIRWLRVIPSGILPPCIWAKAADTPKSRPSMV